jgi:hypothetical protein
MIYQKNSSLPWVGTFSIGPTWTNPGSQQTLQLTPQIEKTYTAYKPQNTLADGELFLGVRKDLPYNLFTHLGIAGAFTSQAGLSGTMQTLSLITMSMVIMFNMVTWH